MAIKANLVKIKCAFKINIELFLKTLALRYNSFNTTIIINVFIVKILVNKTTTTTKIFTNQISDQSDIQIVTVLTT